MSTPLVRWIKNDTHDDYLPFLMLTVLFGLGAVTTVAIVLQTYVAILAVSAPEAYAVEAILRAISG